MEVDKTGIIYCWRNIHTGKRYIGQTIRPKDRFNQHKRHLGNYNGQNHFYRAMNKYSSMSDWEYDVIEEVPKEMLDQREIYWIAFYDSFNQGYNMSKGGMRHDGYKPSEDSRRKISEVLKGRNFSVETRRKISEALKGKPPGNKGKKLSPEARKKISEASKGRKLSPEARKKISEAKKGKPSGNKGKKLSPEARKNMSNAHNSNRIAIYQNDTLIAICDTLKEAACLTDVSHAYVQQIASGKGSKTKSGYSFKYISKSA